LRKLCGGSVQKRKPGGAMSRGDSRTEEGSLASPRGTTPEEKAVTGDEYWKDTQVSAIIGEGGVIGLEWTEGSLNC